MSPFTYCLEVLSETLWPPKSVYSLDHYRKKNSVELPDKTTLSRIDFFFFYFIKENFEPLLLFLWFRRLHSFSSPSLAVELLRHG